MRLLSAAESRALDRMIREKQGLPEAELIERAGREAALFAGRRYGPLRGRRVVVLCGKGHNAADGLVAARHLCASGASVGLACAFGVEDLSPEARRAFVMARDAGADLVPPTAAALADADLLVDALVGTGARLPLQGALAALARFAAAQPAPVLALDLPSGLDADSGALSEPYVRAEATLTFMALKRGLKLFPGREAAGAVFLAPLVDAVAELETLPEPVCELVDLDWVRRRLPARPWDFHKRRAEVLVLAGSKDYLGAALLCGRAAYRGGAGLVRLALPEPLATAAMAALPEAVIQALPVEQAPGQGQLETLLALAEGAHAVVVGPGLGRRGDTQALMRSLWSRLTRPTVFDADALFGLEPGLSPGGDRVLTPHEGEAGRLLGADVSTLGRPAAALRLAREFRAQTLLKGPASLVAAPEGRWAVCESGAPVLASAGTGDVLAGLLGALLAQGAAPFEAAALAAYVHGRAGENWRARHAGRGLLASELADLLPAALAEAGA
jgi:NAD(P)H-hydrate epimerase